MLGERCSKRRWGHGGVARWAPPLHLVVCRFSFSPGGGGERQPGSSGDPVCNVSFGRRGWKRRAPTAGKLQASPVPACAEDSLPVDGAGNPLPWAAQPGPLVRGWQWRPWRPLYNPAAREASPEGFAVETAGLPVPRGVQPSLPLVSPPILGPEQIGGSECCRRGRAISSSGHQEDVELTPGNCPGSRGLRVPEQGSS